MERFKFPAARTQRKKTYLFAIANAVITHNHKMKVKLRSQKMASVLNRWFVGNRVAAAAAAE